MVDLISVAQKRDKLHFYTCKYNPFSQEPLALLPLFHLSRLDLMVQELSDDLNQSQITLHCYVRTFRVIFGYHLPSQMNCP